MKSAKVQKVRNRSSAKSSAAKSSTNGTTKSINGLVVLPSADENWWPTQVAINKIDTGNRFRKDYGDLEPLADSIKSLGLLQPIGITEDFKLVFGGRRLCACRDVLKWTKIEARIVKVSSIIRGEHDENEVRKDFTPSERVAIAKALEAEIGERRGNPSIRHRGDELKGRSDALVAKQAGFSSRRSLRDARKVIENGSPQLIEAMDSEKMSITAAGQMAALPAEEQNKLLDLADRKIRPSAPKVHQNGKPKPATLIGREKPADSRSALEESAMPIFADIDHHHDTLETILTPICDEGQDVKLRPIEKRTLLRIVQELRGFHRDLAQAWLRGGGANRPPK